VKLFGKEPAFWSGLVEAVLAVALSFGLFGLTMDGAAAIVAVVTAALGFVVAYRTRDTLLAVGVGFAKSVFVLMAAYGLTLTDAQTAALIAVITISLGAWQRGKTTPLEQGTFREPTAA
jgi:hypothetical protein